MQIDVDLSVKLNTSKTAHARAVQSDAHHCRKQEAC